jgi:hypothetical protein
VALDDSISNTFTDILCAQITNKEILTTSCRKVELALSTAMISSSSLSASGLSRFCGAMVDVDGWHSSVAFQNENEARWTYFGDAKWTRFLYRLRFEASDKRGSTIPRYSSRNAGIDINSNGTSQAYCSSLQHTYS